jgi:hypothetical protein
LKEPLQRWHRSIEEDPGKYGMHNYSIRMGNGNSRMPSATSRIAAFVLLLSGRRAVRRVCDRYAVRNVSDIIKIVISYVIKAIIFVAVLFWLEPDFEYQPERAPFTDTFPVLQQNSQARKPHFSLAIIPVTVQLRI